MIFFIYLCPFVTFSDICSPCLKDLDKFDAEYFGIPPKQANVLDPQVRKLLEGTYEAIVDAGML